MSPAVTPTAPTTPATPATNTRVVLRERPVDRIEATHFDVVTEAVPEPGERQILVQTEWLGFAPAQRGVLNDVPSYVPPVQVGEVMRATGTGVVVASTHPHYAVGDAVMASVGWQEYAVLSPDAGRAGGDVEKLPAGSDTRMALNVFGSTGMTAYVGMVDFGRPVEGSTVLVTAAAGATGSLAGQIARTLGATRVVGTASTEEKRAWVVEELGFDDCLDYRDPKIFRMLRAAGGDGYDVIFDNVGGELLDNALGAIRIGCRVVLCGAISTGYKPKRAEVGLRNYQFLTTRRSSMAGFLVTDHADRFDAARADLATWIADGRLRYADDVAVGLENAPATLQRLFDGANLGKQLLRVAPETPR